MNKFQRLLPWIVFVLAFVYAVQKFVVIDRIDGAFDLNTFRALPVSADGRTKPIDTVARNSLMKLSGRQSLEFDGRQTTASEWYIEVITRPDLAVTRRVFRIDHPDVLSILGLNEADRTRFSFDELMPHLEEIHKQAGDAFALKSKARDPFQRAILVLNQRIMLFSELSQLQKPYLVPPAEGGGDWRPFVEVLQADADDVDARALLEILRAYRSQGGTAFSIELVDHTRGVLAEDADDPAANALGDVLRTYAGDEANLETDFNDWLVSYAEANPEDTGAQDAVSRLEAYQAGLIESFNTQIAAFSGRIDEGHPAIARRSGYEVVFNQVQPFVAAMFMYVIAFLFGCFGLLTTQLEKKDWSKTMFRSMTALILVAFLIHTVGLVSRVYLQGRPPVTNLYSSAVFIGWFSIIIGLIMDRKTSMGLGGIMASVIGFGTLVVAQNLGSSGDTMEMMQAVLDTNFWLATHVVVVTIGYSATFFGGFLAIAYVLLGVFTKTLDHERGKSLIKMVYGVICFAAVTSFVGTVLGGIWADQSWGRFWGWDAKENGAAMIVLWNLLILHARWGGMIKDRGIVNLAIVGNIITAWSWFGTNMLGVGLHSYGFTNSAVFWILIFVASQLAMMGLGLLPMGMWRSEFKRVKKTPAA